MSKLLNMVSSGNSSKAPEEPQFRPGAVKAPTRQYLEAAANEFGLDVSASDMTAYEGLIGATLAPYTEFFDGYPSDTLETKYARLPGARPEPSDNPLRAWYWKTEIKGASSGPLEGKTVALKDNVQLAGVPMMNGSRVLESYTPECDATVVTRLLDAGATITGKAACEDLCLSGAGITSAMGPVLNPHDKNRSAGGSSGGSAALVASGAVDMALGGDQGGSIRLPSSWCGCVGLKPTWGLVPYTGIMPMEVTLDHAGPIARSCTDAALFLDAIAGPDGLDPRQNGLTFPTPRAGGQSYGTGLDGSLSGIKVGVLKEGFGHPGAEDCVEESVRAAIKALASAGATVTEVSIPVHKGVATTVWTAMAFEGMYECYGRQGAGPTNMKGYYPESMIEAYSRGLKTKARDLSHTNKVMLLLGKYLREEYHGKYYAKSQNLRRKITAQYDAVLQDVDVLVMPTTPMRASTIPPQGCSVEAYWANCLEMIPNTAPFNLTGHPALTVPVPVAKSHGAHPAALQVVGRPGAENTLLRVGHAWEVARSRK